MRLVSLVLFITFESLLVNYAASSLCVSLNNTSLNNCFQAGFNESEFNESRPTQTDISSLIMSMKTKFDNCSNSTTLMTCSLHVPKCSKASSRKLPCKEKCRKFIYDCQHVSVGTEGLMALFRRLCDLLAPCASLSDRSNITEADDYVTCKPLTITQCAGAGYSLTTVSHAYQKLVNESSAIFQNSGSNSTLRKIICMEVAPPCDHKNNLKLHVPCKSTCENAYNESTSQFLDVFRSHDYCSVFPAMNKSYAEQEYCAFQAWPDAGYWPSELWKSLFKAEPSKTSMATSTPTATSAPIMATNNRTDNSTITEPVRSSRSVTHPEASPTIMEQGTTEAGSMETMTTPIPVPTTTVSEGSTTTVTTSVTISPTASSSAASENKGNTTTPTSVSATITLEGTSTALVTTVKASSTATVATPAISKTEIHENSRNRTVATSVEASSIASTAESGSSKLKSMTLLTSTVSSTVSSTKIHGNITVTVPTNSTVSRPAVRSTTGSGIRQSKTVPMTVKITVTTTMTHAIRSVPTTATKGKAPGGQVKNGKKLSAGAVAGIVLGTLAGLAVIVIVAIGYRKYSKRRAQYRHSLMVDMDEL